MGTVAGWPAGAWGLEQADEPQHGSADGPESTGPMARYGKAEGAGDQPCCNVAGAGPDSPRFDMESWAMGRVGDVPGWPGKASEVCSASRTLTLSVTGIFIAILDFQYLFFFRDSVIGI